jgi:hypothetical protein
MQRARLLQILHRALCTAHYATSSALRCLRLYVCKALRYSFKLGFARRYLHSHIVKCRTYGKALLSTEKHSIKLVATTFFTRTPKFHSVVPTPLLPNTLPRSPPRGSFRIRTKSNRATKNPNSKGCKFQLA